MANINRQNVTSRLGTPGLLRTLAQLHEGIQCEASCIRAWQWLMEHWSLQSYDLFDYLRSLIAPRAALEKTPLNVSRRKPLSQLIQRYPRARFIHLTRSVNGNLASLRDFMSTYLHAENRLQERQFKLSAISIINPALVWYTYHRNIIELRSMISPERYLQVKGEDLLQHPRRMLKSICSWLELSGDEAAINAMLRPYESPYASIGPWFAIGGNDANFMRRPVFRPRSQPSVTQTFRQHVSPEIARFDPTAFLQRYRKTRFDDRELGLIRQWAHIMTDEIFKMQRILGYD